jgi:hypothetical protein
LLENGQENGRLEIMDEETVEQMMERAWDEGAYAVTGLSPETALTVPNPYEPVVMVERFNHGIKCDTWDCFCGLGEDWRDTYEEGVLAERDRVKAELFKFEASIGPLAKAALLVADCIEVIDNTIVKEPSE